MGRGVVMMEKPYASLAAFVGGGEELGGYGRIEPARERTALTREVETPVVARLDVGRRPVRPEMANASRHVVRKVHEIPHLWGCACRECCTPDGNKLTVLVVDGWSHSLLPL